MKYNLTKCTQNENEFVMSDWLLKGDSRSIQATIMILHEHFCRLKYVPRPPALDDYPTNRKKDFLIEHIASIYSFNFRRAMVMLYRETWLRPKSLSAMRKGFIKVVGWTL